MNYREKEKTAKKKKGSLNKNSEQFTSADS